MFSSFFMDFQLFSLTFMDFPTRVAVEVARPQGVGQLHVHGVLHGRLGADLGLEDVLFAVHGDLLRVHPALPEVL